MLAVVDKLPRGAPWLHTTLGIPATSRGKVTGPEHEVEVYFRDPITLTQELIGNPTFNHPEIIAYEPHEVYIGPAGASDAELEREFGEANTGAWWNEVQVGFGHLTIERLLTSRPSVKSSRGRNYCAHNLIFRQDSVIEFWWGQNCLAGIFYHWEPRQVDQTKA